MRSAPRWRAGWAQILGSMVFLWVFSGHIEHSMGHLRYLAFYFLCGLGAYLLLYPTSTVRALLPGASPGQGTRCAESPYRRDAYGALHDRLVAAPFEPAR
jgi:hypothetical protein